MKHSCILLSITVNIIVVCVCVCVCLCVEVYYYVIDYETFWLETSMKRCDKFSNGTLLKVTKLSIMLHVSKPDGNQPVAN